MEIAKSIEDLEPQAAVDNCAESTRKWHEKVLSYAHLVRRWTSYFWKINKAYLYSYEDLEQTIWYILMVGLQEFDGRGDEEQFLNWYIRNKIVFCNHVRQKTSKMCTFTIHTYKVRLRLAG
ncbi:hypothetical protein [Fervidobacterium pennivorans]|uniref:hypothetical protein n=1 Tax=Fervidobacterium pennivorans TaxID=93466 RepID=UPI00201B8BF9|nr:hypothetical protein [Fervidobacterium pennivorans]